MSKTIGIDARFYGEAGPGRYAKNIVEYLEKIDHINNYLVFTRQKGFDLYKPQNPNFTKVLAHYKWYSFEEQFQFLFKLLQYKLDLLYVPHFNIPVLYPGRLVTAIPDIIMHTFSTERGTTLPKPYFQLKKFVYYWVVLWAVLRSKKVIVPSLDVKNDFLKAYPFVSTAKYTLAYEGIDPAFMGTEVNFAEISKKYGVTKPFLLYVSSMYEHKNVDRLLEAFIVLQNDFGFTGQLVLIGKKDAFSGCIAKKLPKNVLMPGETAYITDAEVVAVRKSAALYVFPSLKEGFSLTPLEAQVVGLPCVISNIPCHKEIYGDSVLYFDPKDPKDMAKKINTILQDANLQKQLIEKGFANAKKYSWERTAKITLDVFNL